MRAWRAGSSAIASSSTQCGTSSPVSASSSRSGWWRRASRRRRPGESSGCRCRRPRGTARGSACGARSRRPGARAGCRSRALQVLRGRLGAQLDAHAAGSPASATRNQSDGYGNMQSPRTRSGCSPRGPRRAAAARRWCRPSRWSCPALPPRWSASARQSRSRPDPSRRWSHPRSHPWSSRPRHRRSPRGGRGGSKTARIEQGAWSACATGIVSARERPGLRGGRGAGDRRARLTVRARGSRHDPAACVPRVDRRCSPACPERPSRPAS
jgi:hypothetical protein